MFCTMWFTLLAAMLYASSAIAAETPPPVRGIDFWTYDRLHVPLMPTCNLLPNPSFESGLRYWRFSEHGAHRFVANGVPGQEIVEGGLFGRHALKLNAVVGKRILFSFPTPLEEGKTYTLSAYAKSSSGAKCDFRLGLAPAARPEKHPDAYPGQFWTYGDVTNSAAKFKANGEWRRFSRTFRGSGKGLSFSVSGGDGLLVDGFQLEEGGEATSYTEAPVQARLETSDPRNCIPSGSALDATLVLAGNPGAKAKVRYSLENVYRSNIRSGSVEAIFGDGGTAIVKPDFGNLPKGLYVLRCDFAAAGGDGKELSWTDYFRLCVYQPLDNRHATKNVFAAQQWFDHPLGLEAAAFHRRFGFGATTWGSGWRKGARPPDGLEAGRPYVDLLRNNRIECLITTCFNWKLADMSNPRGWTEVTPEMEAAIEDFAYRYAEGLPPDVFRGVAFSNEDERSGLPSSGRYDEYFKAQSAAIRGAKRRYPELRGAPTHGTFMYAPKSTSGLAISNYLRVSREKGFRYDMVGIHCYGLCDKPGRPDLDASLAYLRADMARYGYGPETRICISETGNNSFTRIPEWDCNGWGDDYLREKPSYAWGLKELDYSAEYVRQYLTVLKHWPQVESLHPWVTPYWRDGELTPTALAIGVNALGNLLPDCRYVADIRPVGTVRGFAFDRLATGDALAAVWSVDPGHADGTLPPKCLRVPLPKDAKIADFSGNVNPVQLDGNGLCSLMLTQFPVYIIAPNAKALANAINGAESYDLSDNLTVTCAPDESGMVNLSIANRVSHPFDGTVECNGEKKHISIPAAGAVHVVMPTIGKDGERSAMRSQLVRYVIRADDGASMSGEWKLDWSAVPRFEGEIDWSAIPSLPISNRVDGSPNGMVVGYKAAWCGKGLALRVRIKDPDRVLFLAEWSRQGADSQLWKHDWAIEVYIDTFGDGRTSKVKGYGDDDYRYDFASPPDGKSGRAKVWRMQGVNQQLADGLNYPTDEEVAEKVKAEFVLTKDGGEYRIFFDRRYLMPLELRAGSVAGLGILVHNRNRGEDGEIVYAALSNTTEPGKHCAEAPRIWPLMLLSEAEPRSSSSSSQSDGEERQ